MKTTTCKRCKAKIEFERALFHGKEIGTPSVCDSCGVELDLEEERNALEARRQARIARSRLPGPLQGIPLPETSLGHLAGLWARGGLDKPGLCLEGAVGVGKTYLAAAACWERMRLKGCLWVPISQLFVQLRGGFGPGREAASNAVLGSSAIVFDDLDKANPTDYAREVIFAAVDKRIEVGAPILVTSNLGLEEVEEKYGDAIASRLLGHCEVIHMTGRDRRLA